jgi:tetratricopeptide (TPR) repeat protein
MRGRRRYLLLAGLLLAAGATAWWWYHTTRPDYRLRRGEAALAQGDTDTAEQLIAQLEAGGFADHAHLLAAEFLVRQRHYSQALAELNQMQQRDTSLHLQAATLSGRCLLELGELPEAERAYAFVLSKRPEELDAHRGLAAVHNDLGMLNQAIYDCEQWARLDPRDGRPHRFRGHILRDLNQNDLAIPAYQDALARELAANVRTEVQLELAECQIKRGLFGDALGTLEACHPSARGTARLLTLRAECLHASGRTAEGLPLLERALQADPDHVRALRLRAQLHLEAGEPAAAAVLLERAVKADGYDDISRHQLAQVYHRLGRHAEATAQQHKLKDLQEAMSALTQLTREVMRHPRDPDLQARMAELYDRLNQPEQAARFRHNAALLRARSALPPVVRED